MQKGTKNMKAKYVIILSDGTKKEVYLKKHGKSYVAIFDGKQYDPMEPGTIVTFNGVNKVVNSNIIFFDIDGIKFVTYFNQWAAPKLTVENGARVKSNVMSNNFKIALPLFIGFVVFMVVMMIMIILQ